MSDYISRDELLELYTLDGPINETGVVPLPVIRQNIMDMPAAGGCYCRECIYAQDKYGHIECSNGISYKNTYNDPNMFCSYGKRKGGFNAER